MEEHIRKGKNQPQRPNLLLISSRSSGDPAPAPAKGPVGWGSESACVFGMGTHGVAGIQSVLCPPAFAG